MADIEIRGNNVDAILAEMEQKKEVVLEALGMAAALYAQGNLEHDPRRIKTGNLRRETKSEVREDTAYIGTNVEYAIYVEYGTLKMTASHFLKRSVADHVDEYKNIIIEQMKD